MWLRRVTLALAVGVVLSLPACLASCPGKEPKPDRPTPPPTVKWPVEPPQE